MHESMVVPAQQEAVVQPRIAAIGPMNDVMRVGEAESAAGKATALIAHI